MSDFVYRFLTSYLFITFILISFPASWRLAGGIVKSFDSKKGKVSYSFSHFLFFLNIQILAMFAYFSIVGFWRSQIEITKDAEGGTLIGGICGVLVLALIPRIEYEMGKRKRTSTEDQ
jgi:magnesium-transporting ATPase (P-type)